MNIVVAGALRGLGAALTRKFLDNGETVYALIQPAGNAGELEKAMPNERLKCIRADLTDPKEIEAAVEIIRREAKSVDVVCNVAGVLLKRDEPLTKNTYADIAATFQVNTFAPIYLNNLLLPLMPDGGHSLLLNVCSEIRRIDDVGDWFPLYCFSKTALTQYVFSMDATLKKEGRRVKVLAVHPGRMKTQMGGENSEISPEESAEGIARLVYAQKTPESLYVDYKGRPMLG